MTCRLSLILLLTPIPISANGLTAHEPVVQYDFEYRIYEVKCGKFRYLMEDHMPPDENVICPMLELLRKGLLPEHRVPVLKDQKKRRSNGTEKTGADRTT